MGGIGARHWRLCALLSFVFLLALLAGCGSSTSGETTAQSPTGFDARGAWQLVRMQVATGQRPAGSPQLRHLAARLVKLLPEGSFESVPGEPGLRNVVGSIPGEKPAIVLGAHYDTLVKPKGFVGANNGAAGSAIVIEAAKALERASASGREVNSSSSMVRSRPPASLTVETSTKKACAGRAHT